MGARGLSSSDIEAMADVMLKKLKEKGPAEASTLGKFTLTPRTYTLHTHTHTCTSVPWHSERQDGCISVWNCKKKKNYSTVLARIYCKVCRVDKNERCKRGIK